MSLANSEDKFTIAPAAPAAREGTGLLSAFGLEDEDIVLASLLENETEKLKPIAPIPSTYLIFFTFMVYGIAFVLFIIELTLGLKTLTEQSQIFDNNVSDQITQGSSYPWSCSMLNKVTKESRMPSINSDVTGVIYGYYLGQIQESKNECEAIMKDKDPCVNSDVYFAGTGKQTPWPADHYVADIKYDVDGNMGLLVQQSSFTPVDLDEARPALYIYNPKTATMTKFKGLMCSGPFEFAQLDIDGAGLSTVVFTMRDFNDWKLWDMRGRDITGSYERYRNTNIYFSSKFPTDANYMGDYPYGVYKNSYVADATNVIMTSVFTKQISTTEIQFHLTGGQPGQWGNAGGAYYMTVKWNNFDYNYGYKLTGMDYVYGNVLVGENANIGSSNTAAQVTANYPTNVLGNGLFTDTCKVFGRSDANPGCPYFSAAQSVLSKLDNNKIFLLDHPQNAQNSSIYSCDAAVPFGYYKSCGATALTNRIGYVDMSTWTVNDGATYTELGSSVYDEDKCLALDGLEVGKIYDVWCAPTYQLILDNDENMYVFTPTIMAQVIIDESTKKLSFKVLINLFILNAHGKSNEDFLYGQVDDDFTDQTTQWPVTFGNWYVYKNYVNVAGYIIQPVGAGRVAASFDPDDNNVIYLSDGFQSVYERSHTNMLWAYHFDTATWSSFSSWSQVNTGWFLCGSDIKNYTISNLASIEKDCTTGNGVAFYNSRTDVTSFESLYMSKPFDDSYTCKSSIYKYICDDVGDLPPYSCVRNTTMPFSTALSTAIANSGASYSLLASIVAMILYKLYNRKKNKEEEDTKKNTIEMTEKSVDNNTDVVPSTGAEAFVVQNPLGAP